MQIAMKRHETSAHGIQHNPSVIRLNRGSREILLNPGGNFDAGAIGASTLYQLTNVISGGNKVASINAASNATTAVVTRALSKRCKIGSVKITQYPGSSETYHELTVDTKGLGQLEHRRLTLAEEKFTSLAEEHDQVCSVLQYLHCSSI